MGKKHSKSHLILKRAELQRTVEKLQQAMFIFSEIHLALNYVAHKEQDRRVYMDLSLNANIERMELAIMELENYCG